MKKYGWILYYVVLCTALFAVIIYGLYSEGSIFSPTPPANLEELANWNEPDLFKLLRHYNCSDTPISNVPDDLKDLSRFCSTVRGHWIKAYNESKYDDAREGAERLRQNGSNKKTKS